MRSIKAKSDLKLRQRLRLHELGERQCHVVVFLQPCVIVVSYGLKTTVHDYFNSLTMCTFICAPARHFLIWIRLKEVMINPFQT